MPTGTLGPYTYTTLPALPSGFEELLVRVDSTNGCYRGFTVRRAFIEERVLTLYMSGSDAAVPQCPAFTPVFDSFGVIPRGTYTFITYSCVSNPVPPLPFCVHFKTEQLLVGGGEPTAVPAMGLGGIAVLVLGAFLLARSHVSAPSALGAK